MGEKPQETHLQDSNSETNPNVILAPSIAYTFDANAFPVVPRR